MSRKCAQLSPLKNTTFILQQEYTSAQCKSGLMNIYSVWKDKIFAVRKWIETKKNFFRLHICSAIFTVHIDNAKPDWNKKKNFYDLHICGAIFTVHIHNAKPHWNKKNFYDLHICSAIFTVHIHNAKPDWNKKNFPTCIFAVQYLQCIFTMRNRIETKKLLWLAYLQCNIYSAYSQCETGSKQKKTFPDLHICVA
jgi:hypothetical protein